MKKPILYIFVHFVHFVHVHLAKIWWPCTKMELDPPPTPIKEIERHQQGQVTVLSTLSYSNEICLQYV